MFHLTVFCILFILILIFSITATSAIRKYSLNKSIIDIPNERSSHVLPTPRGGGGSIFLSLLLTLAIAVYLEYLELITAVYLGIPIFLVAIIGWFDDHKHITFYIRFMLYSIAALITINQFGSLEKISFGIIQLPIPGLFGTLVTFLAIVWITNLYNFMDGIDAFASLQAISASLLAGCLLYLEGEIGLSLLCVSIVASNLGFLYWNFPPAKIFMGDIGSCTLGFTFATLALLSDLSGALSVTIWCMLLSVFICDASFTLIKRVFRREKWYEAHRSHAYQKIVQLGVSHRTVSLSLLVINIAFIWPVVIGSYIYPKLTVFLASATFIIMFLIWLLVQYLYSNKLVRPM